MVFVSLIKLVKQVVSAVIYIVSPGGSRDEFSKCAAVFTGRQISVLPDSQLAAFLNEKGYLVDKKARYCFREDCFPGVSERVS